MTELLVRPEAELDTYEAALWYEGEKTGLGAAFLQAVRRVFLRIGESPLQFPAVMGDVRRALLGRFPFGVFFFLEGERATVLAVVHLHRPPATWQVRPRG
jgi:plasmid stabilization system protein ParE